MDEGEDITIQNRVGVIDFEGGAVVFDELIGGEGIGTDLVTERDIREGVKDFIFFLGEFFEFEVIEFSFKHFEGEAAVGMLVTFGA